MGKEELKILGAYNRKILCCIQHLPPPTAIPAIHLLSGIPPMEAMLYTRVLTFFCNIADTNITALLIATILTQHQKQTTLQDNNDQMMAGLLLLNNTVNLLVCRVDRLDQPPLLIRSVSPWKAIQTTTLQTKLKHWEPQSEMTGTTPMKPVMAADSLCQGLTSLKTMITNMDTCLSKEAPPVSWARPHRTLPGPSRHYIATIYRNIRN